MGTFGKWKDYGVKFTAGIRNATNHITRKMWIFHAV
jgi:hypothetical protein